MPASTSTPSVVAARPAETLTIAGAIAFLIARSLGVDNDTTMTALTMVIAFIPAAVTWLVELFSRGKAAAETPEPAASSAAIAEGLAELNKTLREALPARSGDRSNGGAVMTAEEFADAVERVLAAREEKRDARDTASDLLKAAREATRTITELRAGATDPPTRS